MNPTIREEFLLKSKEQTSIIISINSKKEVMLEERLKILLLYA